MNIILPHYKLMFNKKISKFIYLGISPAVFVFSLDDALVS